MTGGRGGSPTKNDFFAFSDVLSGWLQKSVYRTEKSSFVLILWTVQFSKSQGVPFDLETLKLNISKSLRLLGNWCLDLFFGLKTNYSTISKKWPVYFSHLGPEKNFRDIFGPKNCDFFSKSEKSAKFWLWDTFLRKLGPKLKI